MYTVGDEKFKKGDKVRVKKGARIWFRGQWVIQGRSQVVTVNWTSRHEPMDATGKPTVVWPGSSGYWREAFESDCELVERSSK